MSPLNRYTTLFCAKNKSLRQPNKKYQTNTQIRSLTGKRSIFLREFQYKILNNIVFTNDKLFRFGLSQSPNCTFCNEEPESLEHLLSHCKVSSEFWKQVLSWLKENNIVIESFNGIGLFLGIFEEMEDFFIINHVMLLGKYYICKEMPWRFTFVERLYCQDKTSL